MSRAHLLSIPVEIRQDIWRVMLHDVNKRRKNEWFKKPQAEFLPLMLTCRQLCHELQDFRPQHLVPYGTFSSFAYSMEDTVNINPKNASKYRSITLQFPIFAHPQSYKDLEYILYTCKDTLEELNLSFTGADRYGMSTYIHGCAYAPSRQRENKLHPEGQNIRCMSRILRIILEMTKLRILVLSNLNFQLFPTVFKHKPLLQYLHITADPRSAVHRLNVNSGLGIFYTPFDGFFPPIKVLSISANSMKNALAFPSSCAQTLEHLTWTIPDTSLGCNLYDADWFADTRQLIDNFALNQGKLHTLRICVQSVGYYNNTELRTQLEAALTTNISRIMSLRAVEIHARQRCSYFGDAILRALPRTLERFYTRDCLVLPRELLKFITERYLTSQPKPLQEQPVPYDEKDLKIHSWWPQTPRPFHLFEDYVPEHRSDKYSIKMWLHPQTLEAIYHAPESPAHCYEVLRKVSRQGIWGDFHNNIIGEDRNRTDYIPMRSGNLTFVAYEFGNPDHICPTQETMTQMVLRLNGRLLDRAHNKHLARIANGAYIRPKYRDDWPTADEDESWHCSRHPGIRQLLDELHSTGLPDPAVVKAVVSELKGRSSIGDGTCFGDIDKAYQTFLAEQPAKHKDLPRRTYPYSVDSGNDNCDGQCHWMCPEANVPTLAQMDEIGSA